MNTPVRAGLQVRIERGVPVTVLVDGREVRTRTHSRTVSDVLAELGVSLVGKDYVVPAGSDRVQPGLEIAVARITEKQLIEETEIPFETEWLPDSLLEIDHRRVDAVGANGIQRRRYRAVFQNGQEIERKLEDEWVAREPETRKIAYGTKILVRTLETPDGSIEYWRRIPVFLTSYTEATCGKTPDHPWYGLTRLGWKMRRGIIAVDPRVINMLSELYVPGYGRGTAADTGGLIIGRHIDLGHEVDDFVMWFEWGYVYVLTPAPPPSQIRWILPDYPRGRWP
jgi:3D (Asp-Asp-Asp) domain-containing protein